MHQLSARVPEDTNEAIVAYSDENDLTKSEAIRELLDRGSEYARIQRENERLQRNLQQLLEQREEHDELVEYVEDERSLQQRRAERENAPIWKRAQWWVLGRSE